VVSVRDPYDHNLGSLDRSSKFFFQVAVVVYGKQSSDFLMMAQ
jgi:hypothetical protein